MTKYSSQFPVFILLPHDFQVFITVTSIHDKIQYLINLFITIPSIHQITQNVINPIQYPVFIPVSSVHPGKMYHLFITAPNICLGTQYSSEHHKMYQAFLPIPSIHPSTKDLINPSTRY